MLEQGTFHSPLAKRTEHREENIADDTQRGRTFAVPGFHLLKIRRGNTTQGAHRGVSRLFMTFDGVKEPSLSVNSRSKAAVSY
jgi:hypothetical protein